MNILDYLGQVFKKIMEKKPLTVEEKIITATASLSLLPVLVPLAATGAKIAYEEAKKKGWVK